jgi:hypothetical protein
MTGTKLITGPTRNGGPFNNAAEVLSRKSVVDHSDAVSKFLQGHFHTADRA